MTREEILLRLKTHYPEITGRYGVASLGIFGSASRNETGPESDVDVLVRFSGGATLDAYFELKGYLERLLEHRVDLVTEKALRLELRPSIEKDLIHVA